MSNNLWLPLAATIAILGAAAMGVFQPRRYIGRGRLSPDESPLVFLRILALALGTWAICVLLLGSIHQARLKMKNEPATTGLSDAETVVFGGATELGALLTMLAATISLRPSGVRETGINLRRLPTGVLGGFVGILIVLPLIFYVNNFTDWAMQHLRQVHPPHELLEVLKDNPPKWLWAADVISAGVIAPLAEELFFRGLVQTFFRHFTKSSWPAIVISAAAFALVHRWWTWPQIFFLGLCLGYAYERSGNLWVSITIHSLFNLTAIWAFTSLN